MKQIKVIVILNMILVVIMLIVPQHVNYLIMIIGVIMMLQ